VVAGVALREPSESADTTRDSLLQRAELALLAAQTKDEHLVVYRAAMGEVYRRRFQLVTQFRRAVETGRIILHFQPKLTLTERELTGVEALVRWMHPEYGLVSPAEFIEAIEATGSIDILFSHVLDISLAQIAQWARRGLRIGVAVNLSVRNLLAADVPQTVAAALDRHGVPPELLTLEITESSVMAQPEHSLPVLRDLHAMGIQLSVDDFGTGYSSLAYLRRLPIDEIKIDRSFVQGMVTDLGDLAIVRAIIDLGHSLGLRVIAEGVEEEAGRDALRSMRCDGVQGFLLSRPLPLDRFEAWLASRTVPVERSAGELASLRVRG
jgi:EAL domain-containing protein (putative c-di-GMP-specific phosphodiesterase class I)